MNAEEFDFGTFVKGQASQLGIELEGDARGAGMYAAQRAAHLSMLVGLEGYEHALIAERDNVAIRFGLEVTDAADKTTVQILGIIQGGLAMVAKALVIAVA